MQQINGAVLMKQNFSIPEAELLEDLGLGDPAELSKRRKLEDYKNAYIANDLQRMQMELQEEFQKRAMEMQAGIQQQQQSQAMEQEQAMRMQEQQAATAAQGGSPGMENAGGMGMNPALGGMAPVNMGRGQQ